MKTPVHPLATLTLLLLAAPGAALAVPIPCPDADGDGYPDAAVCGDDCDDKDPNVNPGAVEDCNDGIDNDCDGLVDGGDDECAGVGCGARGDGSLLFSVAFSAVVLGVGARRRRSRG